MAWALVAAVGYGTIHLVLLFAGSSRAVQVSVAISLSCVVGLVAFAAMLRGEP